MRYQPHIDGLRAIAVLAVVVFHAFPSSLPGGFIGVDVFFVISGFLITGIIVKSLAAGSFTIRDFYARRARRILPALLVVLAASLVFGWYALLPDEYRALSKHVVGAATFSANFVLWNEAGYFDVDAQFKPLLHLWSLGIEEQFYLIWPLLLLALWRRRRLLWPIVCVLVIGSFVLNVALVYDKPTGTFYFPLTRFWELGLGCLLALSPVPARAAPRFWSGLSGVALLLIVVAAFGFDHKTVFPGWAALIPVLSAVAIIAAGSTSWINKHVLSNPVMVLIGLISYPLYLWHWPLLSFASILEAGEPSVAARTVAAVISFPLAWLTYKLIEVPVRRRSAYRTPLLLASGLAGLAAVGIAVVLAKGFQHRSEFELAMLERGPRFDAACIEFLGAKPPFNYCRSTRKAAPELLVLGDSHAQAIYDGAVAHLGGHHNVMLLASAGCPPLLNVDIYSSKNPAKPNGCSQFWRKFVELTAEMKPAAVVLVGRGPYYFAGDIGLSRQGVERDQRQIAFRDGLRDLVQTLSKSTRVTYVMEQPFFDSTPHCFMRPFTLGDASGCAPVKTRASVDSQMKEYRQLLQQVRDDVPQLEIVDPTPLFCDAQNCYQKPPGRQVLYSDADHLNPLGGRYLVESSGLLGGLRIALRFPEDAYRG